MKRDFLVTLTIMVFLMGSLAAGLTAADAKAILKDVDEHTIGQSAPKDMEADMVMEIHKGDSVKTRELKAWSRNNVEGDDYRLLKFRSPADVKNVGLLVLSEDSMYLYLPEFHRVRRIASSNKKDSFQGSDFSYEDMGASAFSDHYDPSLVKETDTAWVLQLDLKAGEKKPYQKIVMTVCKEKLMPLSMELYGEDGSLWKKMENKIEATGNYQIATLVRMEDLKKGSFTTITLKNIKVDQLLKTMIFTQRFLKRPVR